MMKCSTRFKFPSIRSRGKYDKESSRSFVKETYVNEEYKRAFRTQSYLNICDSVQTHIGFDSGSSSPSIHEHYAHLCEVLLEPQSDTIAELDSMYGLHNLLLDFFAAGLEAWRICEGLLGSIHQVNVNHHKVKQVLVLARRVPNGMQRSELYEQLASYSSLVNPLADFGLEKFPTIHINHKSLLKRLTTKHTSVNRKRKMIKILKKSGGCALVALYTVLAVAVLVLAFHGLVVAVASPGLIACSFGLIKKRNSTEHKIKTSELKWVGAQLDVAAKGVYTMIKDLDTMGWLVGRLYNEVEFGRAMARKCVVNRSPDMLEEVMREFRVRESCFLEQLEELEDRIYLCLLNVNRSRRLVVEEITPMPRSHN